MMKAGFTYLNAQPRSRPPRPVLVVSGLSGSSGLSG